MINVIVSPKLITVCEICKSGLEYELSDVRKKTEVFYNGFFRASDYIVKKHIVCPKCGSEVKLFL
ncbi:hypothetical protein ECF1_0219 [Enterobacter phage EC-F1]|nr:hypothetical protein ECF1_0219 [Enterobacter phage EC-F1]